VHLPPPNEVLINKVIPLDSLVLKITTQRMLIIVALFAGLFATFLVERKYHIRITDDPAVEFNAVYIGDQIDLLYRNDDGVWLTLIPDKRLLAYIEKEDDDYAVIRLNIWDRLIAKNCKYLSIR
jgi:hypothetical protein